MNSITEWFARLLLAQIFLLAGLNKIGGYEGTQAYMESMGVPGVLLPAVIVVEVLGAILIITGYYTRLAAAALAGFTVIAAIIFHAEFADKMQMIMFMKNVAITGGLLLLVVNGAGDISVDSRLKKSDD